MVVVADVVAVDLNEESGSRYGVTGDSVLGVLVLANVVVADVTDESWGRYGATGDGVVVVVDVADVGGALLGQLTGHPTSWA